MFCLTPSLQDVLSLFAEALKHFLPTLQNSVTNFRNQIMNGCVLLVSRKRKQAERLLAWAKSDKPLQGGLLGEWIFNRGLPKVQIEVEVPEFSTSLTVNAVLKDWKTPTEFICCPQESTNNPIATYATNIKIGETFSMNQFAKAFAVNVAISKDKDTLWIMCEFSKGDSIKP